MWLLAAADVAALAMARIRGSRCRVPGLAGRVAPAVWLRGASEGWRGLVPPCAQDPVGGNGHDGGQDGGRGRDERDLPSAHAAGGHDLDRGGGSDGLSVVRDAVARASGADAAVAMMAARRRVWRVMSMVVSLVAWRVCRLPDTGSW